MTPTSAGGEQQNYISGGIQSPIWYSLRQDCRDAQKNMSCIAWRASRSKNAEGILESALNRVDIYFSFRLKRSWNILYVICVVKFSSSHSLTCFARVCWFRLAKSSAYPRYWFTSSRIVFSRSEYVWQEPIISSILDMSCPCDWMGSCYRVLKK